MSLLDVVADAALGVEAVDGNGADATRRPHLEPMDPARPGLRHRCVRAAWLGGSVAGGWWLAGGWQPQAARQPARRSCYCYGMYSCSSL